MQSLSQDGPTELSVWEQQDQRLIETEAASLATVGPRALVRRPIDKGHLPASKYGLGGKQIYRIKRDDLANVQWAEPPSQDDIRRICPEGRCHRGAFCASRHR